MNNMNMETEKSSRKKLLVPLVVLLLCAVSLTGAAYAYNATLKVAENPVDAGYLSVDLKGGSASVGTAESSNITFGDSKVVVFTDNFEYSKNAQNAWVKTDLVKYSLAGGTIVTYKVNIARDNESVVDLKVDVSGLAGIKIKTSGVDKSLTELFKVKVSLDGAAAQEATLDDGVESITFEDVEVKDHTVAISFVPIAETQNGNVTNGAVEMTDSASDMTAAKYQAAFNGSKFTVDFTATPAA